MKMNTLLLFAFLMVFSSAQGFCQTSEASVKPEDSRKKSLVTSKPITNEELREYVDIIDLNAKKDTPALDEGTNDPTVSGMTLIYTHEGKPAYVKNYFVNGLHMLITYIPKE